VNDDPIGAYLARLRRSLRGRPNRARVLAETEDHLRESTEALVRRGMPADVAAREAVNRMGGAERRSPLPRRSGWSASVCMWASTRAAARSRFASSAPCFAWPWRRSSWWSRSAGSI
jgi:hypothetical protein